MQPKRNLDFRHAHYAALYETTVLNGSLSDAARMLSISLSTMKRMICPNHPSFDLRAARMVELGRVHRDQITAIQHGKLL